MSKKFNDFQLATTALLSCNDVQNIVVTFTKADGTERQLRCTLRNIPEEDLPKGTGTTSDEAQRVYDLDKEAWRSFRWDSVKSVSFEPKGEDNE